MDIFDYNLYGRLATCARGKQLPQSKLTEDDVRWIRQSSMPRKIIAKKFGVHYRTIEKIRQFQSWTHVR